MPFDPPVHPVPPRTRPDAVLEWRPMREADIEGVVAVARLAFPDHFEARACFEERLALFAPGCFALARCDDERLRGYLIAYPWPFGMIPPLDTLLGELPESRAAFYLHDLALHPEARGQGHARPAIERLCRELRKLGGERLALVSVKGSVPFWRGMGFAPVTGDGAIDRKLASYGDDASYMARGL